MEPWIELDKKHVWHPYNSLPSKSKLLSVKRTFDTYIELEDDRVLIDAMSSWWSAIHGYNNPVLTKALKQQVDIMPHIMFGGLAHEKAALLSSKLSQLTSLNSVFLCDSGSVSIEVALKTAIAYYEAKGENKHKFIAFEHAYHGDTLAAMSICDPINSMHSIYGSYLPTQIFSPAPKLGINENNKEEIESFLQLVKANHQDVAGVVIEPIVQGAGGMRIYNPDFLKEVRKICTKYDLLLIIDEIATGFGHTGKMFACEHANVKADIMTVGKGLTGGYMSFAAMLCTKEISDVISNSKIGALMHGPTFMGNPLACSVALASLEILESGVWKKQVNDIENIFSKELEKAKDLELVKDVRNIGAIGVIELQSDKYAQKIQDYCENNGVWIRPFGKLVYSIVSYTIKKEDLEKIISVMIAAIKSIKE